jgi:hypothetical protein
MPFPSINGIGGMVNYDLDALARDVAALFSIEPSRIFTAGKYPLIVQARSLFCFWAVRELGMTATRIWQENSI